MSAIQATDKIMVQRGATLFSAPADMSTVQNTDLILVNRGGVDYQCTVADWKTSVGPGAPAAALPTIDKPSITFPAAGATDVPHAPRLTSSTFRGNNGATHVSTDWQITTAADTVFATPIQQSMGNTRERTIWNAPGLAAGASLLCRVRYHGGSSVVSPWSDVVAFTVAAVETVSSWKPILRYSEDRSTGTTRFIAQGTAFAIPGATTHLMTDWRLLNGDGSGAVVFENLGDKVNLTTWTVPTTAYGPHEEYYIQARYHGNGTVSDWSRPEDANFNTP